jgi:ubiquinone/menaquinone biosynthesis C-methylase UbiE
MSQQEDVIKRWSNSAPYWEKHRETIRRMFAPVSEALIADAEVVSGNSVLDVATGPGEPALRVSETVGPQGEVIGTDPIPGMIDAARRESTRLSIPNARFELASADNLPFPDSRFDAEVSRFGVMFFPDPLAGIREMLRVLKPDKKLALAVWHFPDNNPFHYCFARVVDRFAPEPPLPPDAPDAFRFAQPGKLKNVMAEAAVRDVNERLFRFSIDITASVEEFWNLRLEMSEKLRQRLAALPPDTLADLKHQALDAFRNYATGNALSFPGEVLIVSGRK